MMSYLDLEISSIMQGYECALRTSVGDCPRYVAEMKALAAKHPENAVIRLRLAEMGETKTLAGTVKSHGDSHIVL